MTLKEEFEKALQEKLAKNDYESIAYWAAKWMAEKCALITQSMMTGEKEESHEFAKDARSFITAVMIRQLAKELE